MPRHWHGVRVEEQLQCRNWQINSTALGAAWLMDGETEMTKTALKQHKPDQRSSHAANSSQWLLHSRAACNHSNLPASQDNGPDTIVEMMFEPSKDLMRKALDLEL